MRMTLSMKQYVENQVFAKVKDQYDAAQAASKALKKRREEELKAVSEYANGLIVGLTAKVAAFAAKKFHLHFVETERSCWGPDKPNELFSSNVGETDFLETKDSGRYNEEEMNPYRRADLEVYEEPGRIAAAAKRASDKLIFEFELGKRAKSELDKAIAECEVAL